jgi:hypothetical protein
MASGRPVQKHSTLVNQKYANGKLEKTMTELHRLTTKMQNH